MKRALLIAVLAALALASPAAAATVRVADPVSGRLLTRPAKLQFKDVSFTRLRWHGWGGARTWARGRARVNTCRPSCADGRIMRSGVTVTLTRRKRRGGRRQYTCMSWRTDRTPGDLPAANAVDPGTLRTCRFRMAGEVRPPTPEEDTGVRSAAQARGSNLETLRRIVVHRRAALAGACFESPEAGGEVEIFRRQGDAWVHVTGGSDVSGGSTMRAVFDGCVGLSLTAG